MRSFFSALLIASLAAMTASLPAAEQDNWYLADEWSVPYAQGVAYEMNATIGKGRIYVCRARSSGTVNVYETNGTLVREISGLYYPGDVAVDGNGTIYVAEERRVSAFDQEGNILWRLGKNANSGSGSSGSGDGEFNDALGIAVSPNGELFVADEENHRVQVLDRNGTYKRKFGSQGSAPGQLSYPKDLVCLPDGTLVVGDNSYLHYFQPDGTFIKRTNTSYARKLLSVAEDGTLFSNHHLRGSNGISLRSCSFISEYSRTCFTPEGDLIESYDSKIKIWKRAYRTKGLVNRNVIPQPAIRGISQRAGTNVIDLDFEIIDPDDANATVGILAAVDGAFDDISKWILPTAWVDGTGSKIGVPLATNQVHRVSWNVKGDWAEQTGTLKFEVLCRDARRVAHPVDLHFLELPLADGNMTISRSPLTDSDFETHFKYLLAKGTDKIILDDSRIMLDGNATNQYVFTNAGAIGRHGPTWTDVNASYSGTNLEGNVSMTTQGIQEWTVPTTGTYTIEVLGAAGGTQPEYSYFRSMGTRMKGEFSLVQGDVLLIAVGQKGSDTSNSDNEGGGGGGSFVAKGSDIATAIPLIIAAGGGGDGSDSNGDNGRVETTTWGNSNPGEGGSGNNGGGGFASSGGGEKGGQGFRQGLVGGEGSPGHGNGGFGGGSGGIDETGSSGGGYTGGVSNDGANKGGGGSYNAGANQVNVAGFNNSHGRVFIAFGTGVTSIPSPLLSSSRDSTQFGRLQFMQELGYRFATVEEVNKAREAATPGSVNKWTATRQVKPRSLPGKVNEFGFDTFRTPSDSARYWWVVKEQE